MDVQQGATAALPVFKSEWIGAELIDSEIEDFKGWELPRKKRYRAVRIHKDQVLEFGLGDIVHLESGAEPYLARIVAFYEDSQGTKQFQAQWLYRVTDLPKNPGNLQPKEVFLTTHNDPNRVEVIIEAVRCKLVDSVGKAFITTLFADGTDAPSNVSQDTSYQILRAFDQVTHAVGPLSNEQVEALRSYKDSTTAVVHTISISKKKRSTPAEPKKNDSKDAATFVGDSASKKKKQRTSDSPEHTPQDSRDVGSSDSSRTNSDSKSQKHLGASELSTDSVARSTVATTITSTEESTEEISWEHVVSCSDKSCACFPKKKLLNHASTVPCKERDCVLCSQYVAAVGLHALRCRLQPCPLPKCESFRPVAAVEHALSCRDAGGEGSCGYSSGCLRWKRSLKHVLVECTVQDCEHCAFVNRALEQHEVLCPNGMCRHPKCLVFNSVLSHGAKTNGGIHCMNQQKGKGSCIECALFKRLHTLHVNNCKAKPGRCRFPHCEGCGGSSTNDKSPQDEEISFVGSPGENGLTQEAFSSSFEKTTMMTRNQRPSPMKKPSGPEEHHPVPIGDKFQAKIEPWTGPPSLSSARSTLRDLPLWTPSNSMDVQEEVRKVVKTERLYLGKVVPVTITNENDDGGEAVGAAPSRFMLCRVVRVPKSGESDQTFWAVPYDALWPSTSADPSSIIPSSFSAARSSSARSPSSSSSLNFVHPLACKFRPESIPVHDTQFEQAMLSAQHRYLASTYGPQCSDAIRLKEILDSEQFSGLSNFAFLESWSENEFRVFCKAVRERRSNLSMPLIQNRLGGTKSLAEIVRMFYFHADGVANAPAGLVLCTKCLRADARAACKQYFQCRTALCSSCFKSAASRSSLEIDPSDGSFWFCPTCCEGDVKSNTGDSTTTVRLYEPCDGYDETIAWNSRSTSSLRGRTIVDAVAALDNLFYLFPQSTYSLIVSNLSRFDEAKLSEEELLARLEEAGKEFEEIGRPISDILQGFIPPSLRAEQ